MFEALIAFMQGLFGQVTDPTRLAEQPVRRRLLSLIQSRPGIHASEICRTSGEPWGTVQYHLNLLNKANLVTTVAAGRERHFFPSATNPERARMLALVHQGRRAEIVEHIRSNPGSRQVDVCDALGISRKTFRSSVLPLVRSGLVAEKRGLQSNRYYPLEPLDKLLADEPETAVDAPLAGSVTSSPEFI